MVDKMKPIIKTESEKLQDELEPIASTPSTSSKEEDRGGGDLTLVIESQDILLKDLRRDNFDLLKEKAGWQTDRVKLKGTESILGDLTSKLAKIIKINNALRALNGDLEIDNQALKNDNIKLAKQIEDKIEDMRKNGL